MAPGESQSRLEEALEVVRAKQLAKVTKDSMLVLEEPSDLDLKVVNPR